MVYLFLAIFWSWSSLRSLYVMGGVLSLTFVLFANCAGQTLSIVLDGIPQWNLVASIAIQFCFGLVGVYLMRIEKKEKVKNMV